jgi:hypothetical protein
VFLVCGWGGRDTLDIRLIWVYNRRMKTQDEAPTKSFSIRVSVEMLDALRKVAKQHNRSIHGEILTALSEHIKKSQKEQRKP